MSEEEFDRFYNALITAETAPIKAFEKECFSKGVCRLKRWLNGEEKTMLFGPMKPVGLEDPRTGKRPYAVVQLRQDDALVHYLILWDFKPI